MIATALAMLAGIALLAANVVALLALCFAMLLAAHALLRWSVRHIEAILLALIEAAVITAFCGLLLLFLNGQLPGGLPSPYDPVIASPGGQLLFTALIGYAWAMYMFFLIASVFMGFPGILAEQVFGADDEPWKRETERCERAVREQQPVQATTDAEFHERLRRAERMVEEDPSVLR